MDGVVYAVLSFSEGPWPVGEIERGIGYIIRDFSRQPCEVDAPRERPAIVLDEPSLHLLVPFFAGHKFAPEQVPRVQKPCRMLVQTRKESIWNGRIGRKFASVRRGSRTFVFTT